MKVILGFFVIFSITPFCLLAEESFDLCQFGLSKPQKPQTLYSKLPGQVRDLLSSTNNALLEKEIHTLMQEVSYLVGDDLKVIADIAQPSHDYLLDALSFSSAKQKKLETKAKSTYELQDLSRDVQQKRLSVLRKKLKKLLDLESSSLTVEAFKVQLHTLQAMLDAYSYGFAESVDHSKIKPYTVSGRNDANRSYLFSALDHFNLALDAALKLGHPEKLLDVIKFYKAKHMVNMSQYLSNSNVFMGGSPAEPDEKFYVVVKEAHDLLDSLVQKWGSSEELKTTNLDYYLQARYHLYRLKSKKILEHGKERIYFKDLPFLVIKPNSVLAANTESSIIEEAFLLVDDKWLNRHLFSKGSGILFQLLLDLRWTYYYLGSEDSRYRVVSEYLFNLYHKVNSREISLSEFKDAFFEAEVNSGSEKISL